MHTYRLTVFSFVIILLTAIIVSPVFSATTSSQVLTPLSLTTQAGSTSGSLSSLGTLDQSNSDDSPSAYLTFSTPSVLYSGYSTYQLPLDISPNKISSLLLQVNFKGPDTASQVWTWSIFDWKSQLWIKVADTIGTQPDVWNDITFRVRNFSSYISSSREIRIRLQSNNATADAKLDYQALHITYIPVVSTATQSIATSVPTKGVFVLPTTVTPSPTLTPSITPSPTNTPTRTPTATRTPTITNTPLPGFTWPQINLVTFKAGFSSPVFITNANDGTDRIFVVERCGTVRIIDAGGNLLATPFINISSLLTCTGGEQGLLSIAFPPNYASKNYFYAAYTISNGSLRVSRFDVPSLNQASVSNPDVIITIPHPSNTNHNGGQLAFGNDGYLYISTGDGGGGGDPENNAQNKLSWLGKILRIDVESGVIPYAIPPTNPFVSTSGYLDEIWAMGLRNPWRFSFDRLTHDLYIADVGQSSWEELDFQAASSAGGENYGWRCYEGNHAYTTTGCQPQNTYKAPLLEYSSASGQPHCSVTGGSVYRGSEFVDMQGVYFYGDYCSGYIWGLKKFNGNWYNQMLLDTTHNISTFGEDEAGNIYFANISNGTIYKIETPVSGPAPTIAGCPLFPANNIWNARVDSLPVHSRSSQWISSIGSTDTFHMDFGSGIWPPTTGGPIGIPYNAVAGSSVTKYTVDFYYPDDSDAGPYPIPANPNIEFGSDHHILVVDTETCTLYETYDMSFSGGQWSGGSGAIWSMNSNTLRPNTWTSADAAGLPILPGLVRYEEVASGNINHAIRFTANATNSFIWPARHLTSGTEGVLTSTPPMGARFRLKASYDISGFSPEMQVILRAMKEYGIILADNGSDWYVSGAPSESWDNDMLHTLDVLKGSDFEAVDTSSLIVNIDSGQAAP